MDPIQDRRVKRITWVATGLTIVVALTCQYPSIKGPHIFSGVHDSLLGWKSWLLKPTQYELDEMRFRHQMRLDEETVEAAAKGVKPKRS